MQQVLVSLTFLALLAGGASPPAAPAQTTNELPGDQLSSTVRRAIGKRMAHHSANLGDLLKAVLILDRDGVQERVKAITDAPKLARPAPGETDTLNAAVPPRFFELQDAMVKRAIAVSDAAKKRDDLQMGKAFGQLTEACVACHSVYLWKPTPDDH